jgi:hypothetical protein
LLAWHRDHFSGSVADAIHPRSLDTSRVYDEDPDFNNGTDVPEVPPGVGIRTVQADCTIRAAMNFSIPARGYKYFPANRTYVIFLPRLHRESVLAQMRSSAHTSSVVK